MNGEDQTDLLIEIRDLLREQLQMFRENQTRQEAFMQDQVKSRRSVLLAMPALIIGSMMAAWLIISWIGE
jgi:hypothetical protein